MHTQPTTPLDIIEQPHQTEQAPVSQRKIILAGSVGNAVEWFDWTIYATFAVFFF